MTHDDSCDELAQTLAELEALQAAETAALREMRNAAIDEITAGKERLCAHLREVAKRVRPEHRHRESLERLRSTAVLNQLLLVHARDTVRTILTQVTGASFETLPSTRRSFAPEGVRLNVRV